MAEQLLHHPEVGAVLQEVAGEGVAQDVRADLVGAQAGGGGHRLQVAGEGLAGDVAGLAVGGKQPGAGGRQGGEMGRHGGARHLGQRHQALAPALAAHHQEPLLGGPRGAGQGDQLGDAQARGVEKLDQAVHSPGPGRLGGVRRLGGGLLGDGEQPVDLGHREHLGQAAAALGPRNRGGGIALGQALRIEEAVEAAHAGQPARRRGALEATRLQLGEVGPDARGLDGAGSKPQARQVAEIVVEIAPIGRERVGGRAPLGGQHVEIGVHQALGAQGAHSPPLISAAAWRWGS